MARLVFRPLPTPGRYAVRATAPTGHVIHKEEPVKAVMIKVHYLSDMIFVSS